MVYQSKECPSEFSVSEVEWKQIVEIEGVLNISQMLKNMSQYEKLYTGAYSNLIKRHVYQLLRRNFIWLVDLKSVKQPTQLPRVNSDVRSMTMIGSTCRNRALLEFERRLIWNTSEVPFEYPVGIDTNDRQLISTLLDLRTLKYLGHTDIYRKLINILLKEYVRFSVQFYKYERAVKKEELGDAEKSKDDDNVVTIIISTNAANTDYTHLQNASDSSSESSFNSSEQDCEETLQSDDAYNANISLNMDIKRWCGYVVDWEATYPRTELPDG